MKKKILLALMLFLSFANPAEALKISPFKVALDGTADSQVFRVENNTAEPAAVQVSVLTWEIAPDGQEVNSDAEDDFVVFPAQLVLPPHESRAVRVQFLGAREGRAEKSYRLLAEQLPVHLKETPGAGSAVRFMLRFKAALYIRPGKTVSDVKVKSAENMPDGTLRLTLLNAGTGHTLLRKPVLGLTLADGQKISVTGEALKTLDGENIHAGGERWFDISLPPVAAGRVAAAEFDFEPSF